MLNDAFGKPREFCAYLYVNFLASIQRQTAFRKAFLSVRKEDLL